MPGPLGGGWGGATETSLRAVSPPHTPGGALQKGRTGEAHRKWLDRGTKVTVMTSTPT